MDFLIATHNEGKKKELQKLLSELHISLLTLDDIPQHIVLPEETGTTYEENALIKAKAAGDRTGITTIADDSGIEVTALPNVLGVKSARYADGTTDGRIQQLLKDLQDKQDRSARYVCSIVLYDPTTHTHQAFTGIWEGAVSYERKGTHGFDYDFVFVPKGYKNTVGELGEEIKNTYSHRAVALQKLREYLSVQKK